MTLKITPKDLETLRAAIAPLDTEERRAAYRAGNFSNAARTKDKDKRYRWDLLFATGLKIGDGAGAPGSLDLYAYLNDQHIDSALRSIVAPLEQQVQA